MASVPETQGQATLQVVSTIPVSASVPSWLHTNLRNVLALGITLVVCWLALWGNEQAQAGLIAAFSVLVGVIWGERAALKVPGKDS